MSNKSKPTDAVTSELQAKLNWFLHLIDLQLEDLTILEQGRNIAIYFDASDVRRAVLGMYALYTPGVGLRWGEFNEDLTLVHSLAASGWLGQIGMLPPHQSEFLTLLNLDFGLKNVPTPDSFGEAFWQATGLGDPARHLKDVSGEELVREYADSARGLFKAVQNMRCGTWQRRLISLRQDQILVLDETTEKYDKLVRSPYFRRLLEELQVCRPSYPSSNFADALVLTQLIAQMQTLPEKQDAPVPRFFVSKRTLETAVINSHVADLLTSTLNGGLNVTAFRHADYFIAKAAFQPPRKYPAAAYHDYFGNITNLTRLRREIASIFVSDQPLSAGVLDRIVVSDTPLIEIIEQLQSFSFLRDVWLPYAVSHEIPSVARELYDTTQLLRSDDFQKHMSVAIRHTKQALEDNIREYRRVVLLLGTLQQRVHWLRSRLKRTSPVLDLFRDFGLIRFGLPEKNLPAIRQLLEVILDGDDYAVGEVCISVVNAGEAARINSRTAIDELALFSAALWVVQIDRALVSLLDRLEELPHFSFALIKAAAIIRDGRDIFEAQRMLTEWEGDLGSDNSSLPQGDLAVGVAYLCFHMWLAKGFHATWRGSSPASHVGYVFVDKAIRYARIAYDRLPPGEKRVYALNQLTYYLVEGGTEDRAHEMDDSAKK